MASTFEANPCSGQTTLMDKLKCLVIVPILPWTLLQVVFRRVFFATNNLTFKADFACSIARAFLPRMPLAIGRSTGQDLEKKLETSKRFANVKNELYEKVSGPDFAGYWICKGAPGKAQSPDQCDLVIYYCHGGAYKMNHPATSLSVLLRIAEIVSSNGISVAIFALNYSLAPEAQYPTQNTQAKAAYRYLLEDQEIQPSKIAMLGDSAGAHAVLTFITAVYEEQLPKPSAGLFILAPWLDLRCSTDGSFVRNRHADYLTRDLLIDAGYAFMPQHYDTTLPHIINFTRPRPDKRSWADILPKNVWIGIGGNDLFLDDNVAFVDRLKADGANVDFEIDEGRCHDWHVLEDTLDTDEYFATVGEIPEGLMKGSARVAKAMISAVKS